MDDATLRPPVVREGSAGQAPRPANERVKPQVTQWALETAQVAAP